MRKLLGVFLLSCMLLLSGCNNNRTEKLVNLQVERFLSGIKNQDAVAMGEVIASVAAVIDRRGAPEETQTYSRETFVDKMQEMFADPTLFPKDSRMYFGPITTKAIQDAAVATVTMTDGSAAQTWVFTLRKVDETWLISLWEINDEKATSPTKSVIVVGKIIDSHSMEPVSVTVEAWQSSERDRRAGSDNHWKIPNWVNPRVRTGDDGTFFLTLHDHPKLRTHQYYLVFGAHEHEYAHQGMYVTMDKVTTGQILNVGLVSLRRRDSTY